MEYIEIPQSMKRTVKNMAEERLVKEIPIFFISIKYMVPMEFVKVYINQYSYEIYQLVDGRKNESLDDAFTAISYTEEVSKALVMKSYNWYKDLQEKDRKLRNHPVIKFLNKIKKL